MPQNMLAAAKDCQRILVPERSQDFDVGVQVQCEEVFAWPVTREAFEVIGIRLLASSSGASADAGAADNDSGIEDSDSDSMDCSAGQHDIISSASVAAELQLTRGSASWSWIDWTTDSSKACPVVLESSGSSGIDGHWPVQAADAEKGTVTLTFPSSSTAALQILAASTTSLMLVARLPIMKTSVQCCRLEVHSWQLAPDAQFPPWLKREIPEINIDSLLFAGRPDRCVSLLLLTVFNIIDRK